MQVKQMLDMQFESNMQQLDAATAAQLRRWYAHDVRDASIAVAALAPTVLAHVQRHIAETYLSRSDTLDEIGEHESPQLMVASVAEQCRETRDDHFVEEVVSCLAREARQHLDELLAAVETLARAEVE